MPEHVKSTRKNKTHIVETFNSPITIIKTYYQAYTI